MERVSRGCGIKQRKQHINFVCCISDLAFSISFYLDMFCTLLYMQNALFLSTVIFSLSLPPLPPPPPPPFPYDDRILFAALESSLKTTVTNAINKRCHCDFREDLIDLGEISCHYTIGRSAVYRHVILSHCLHFFMVLYAVVCIRTITVFKILEWWPFPGSIL